MDEQTETSIRRKPVRTSTPNGCLPIFRGSDWDQELSPGQMQQVGDHWMGGVDRFKDEGKCGGGDPLEGGGEIISGRNRIVSDSPFAECKETIGGYFLLTVGTLDEAVAIATECPGLPHGIHMEVRPIAPECPVAEELGAAAELAKA
jgi:hypothetical protein